MWAVLLRICVLMCTTFDSMKLCLQTDESQDAAAPRKTDLKLFPELGGITLGIHSQHLSVRDGKLVHQDGRLSTQAGLQNGIMDEDILLLRGEQNHLRDLYVCLRQHVYSILTLN